MAAPSSSRSAMLRWLLPIFVAVGFWLMLGSMTNTLEEDPFTKDLKSAHADTALAKNDIPAATRAFDTLLRSNKNDASAYIAIAQMCIFSKHYDLAIRYLESSQIACKDQPRPVRAQLYVSLSSAYTYLEKEHPQNRALVAAARAYELDPNSPVTLNTYGYMLADNNIKLDEAIACISRALEILKKTPGAPSDTIAQTEDSYGWTLVKQGKGEQAVNALYQAVNDYPAELPSQLPPDMQKLVQIQRAEALKTLYYHLGSAYRLNKQPDKARNALLTSLLYDKDYPEANAEMKALDAEQPAGALNPRPQSALPSPAGATGKKESASKGSL